MERGILWDPDQLNKLMTSLSITNHPIARKKMMKHIAYKNRRIVLASRPVGAPTNDNFRIEETSVPTLKDGELLLRSIYRNAGRP